MLTLLLALLASPVSANEVPANANRYSCAGEGSRAEVFDAFDANWQRLYSSANVKSGAFEFAGFVTSESVVRGKLVYVTWQGQGFRLVGKFTPSLPSRNFSATLYVDGRDAPVELGCLF